MEIVVLDSIACVFAQKVVVNERLGGLAGEFHHHACRCVCVHVGILACHIIVLDVDDLQEDVCSLCLSGYTSCIAVFDVSLCYVFARTFHEFVFHHVLNVLHRHLGFTLHGDAVGNLAYQAFVFTLLSGIHGFTDSGCYLLLVESNDASVSLFDCLYHGRVICYVIIWFSVLFADILAPFFNKKICEACFLVRKDLAKIYKRIISRKQIALKIIHFGLFIFLSQTKSFPKQIVT